MVTQLCRICTLYDLHQLYRQGIAPLPLNQLKQSIIAIGKIFYLHTWWLCVASVVIFIYTCRIQTDAVTAVQSLDDRRFDIICSQLDISLKPVWGLKCGYMTDMHVPCFFTRHFFRQPQVWPCSTETGIPFEIKAALRTTCMGSEKLQKIVLLNS